MSAGRVLAVVVATAVLLAGVTILVRPAPRLNPREQGLVVEWLVCIDCGSLRDSIQAIGARKPVPTVDTLNQALVHGHPAARLTAADSVLAIAYVRDSTYRIRNHLPPPPVSRAAYVQTGHLRYDDGYRSRAAAGLGWIHSARAVAALNAALQLRLATSVRRAVVYSLDSLPRPP